MGDSPNLEAMTKKQIDEWAAARGVELDGRKTKADMIADLTAALAAETSDETPAPAPADKPAKAKGPKTVTIQIDEHPQSRGVDLRVNGRYRLLPLREPVDVPVEALGALDESDVSYRRLD